jgi:PD-(D/E)XK nuclease superfamily protein
MQETDRLDPISRRIMGDAIAVHRHPGPGLPESAYRSCVAFELRHLALDVEEQNPLPVIYTDVKPIASVSQESRTANELSCPSSQEGSEANRE